MKNTLKKVIASAMAVASLTISTAGLNVNATGTNALGSTEDIMSEIPTRTSYSFTLRNSNEQGVVFVSGPKLKYYTASVSSNGVNIIIRDESDELIDSHYFSAGYAPSYYVYVPEGEDYYFYAQSNAASSSNPISVTLSIYNSWA
jgi:hypothetical protein